MTAGRFGRLLAVAGLALSLTTCGADPGRPAGESGRDEQVDLPKSYKFVPPRSRSPWARP